LLNLRVLAATVAQKDGDTVLNGRVQFVGEGVAVVAVVVDGEPVRVFFFLGQEDSVIIVFGKSFGKAAAHVFILL
jgi:hypothetical protein